MSASASGEISAEPNLTPLLDVVFQLITFFMLVMNFNADTFDQRVRLPVAASASAPEPGKGVIEDRITLNINKDGELYWAGETLDPDSASKEIKAKADFVKFSASKGKKDGEADFADGLPTIIVIRADRDTESGQVYRYIQMCQGYNFRKFSLKAMSAEEDR